MAARHSTMKTWLSVSDTSKTQKNLSKYTIKMTSAQKEFLDQKISVFFYASNVSFLSVELKYFVEMIQTLRPGYSSPSRRNLAGPLLDTAHIYIYRIYTVSYTHLRAHETPEHLVCRL